MGLLWSDADVSRSAMRSSLEKTEFKTPVSSPCATVSRRERNRASEQVFKGIPCAVAVVVDPCVKVPYYSDMRSMMETEKGVDIVSVLTPSGWHAKHVLQLAQYGKPIVVEKPMALTLDDADSMIAACDTNHVRLFVVKQNRFNLPVLKLREAIESGR